VNDVGVRHDAVVFDLFGTLVPEFPRDRFHGALAAGAALLGVDPEGFRREWEATALERQMGVLPTVDANVREILRRLGSTAAEDAVRAALVPRSELYRELFAPKLDAVRTLAQLRARGYRLGLISMCSPDTPALWRSSPLAGSVDVEVFSCEVGLRKPDPKIYRACTDRLGTDPSRCLYVGDGAYGELTGAAAIGMHPVLIRHPGEEDGVVLRPESEPWDGRAVGSLPEVLELV
jgi:putative hydrolase of the HAD superfamily